MNRLVTSSVAATILVIMSANIAQAQSDPRLGTWKLAVEKSKYTPGPPPAGETRTYAASADNRIQVNIETVDSKDNHILLSYIGQDDGKDYALTGLAVADAVATRRIDANIFETDTKKDGQTIGTARVEISEDGKIMTIISSLTVAHQTINNIAVFEKH